ncbi:MAG TPA: universal stress protein [Candidatus Eisenbacteria bacterium]|nr:universal stress protein [Candidatus Eisenbacteria bacterium]
MRLRRLLVPHDLSTHADRALKVAAGLAGPSGKLLVLHVVVPIVPIADMSAAGGFYIPLGDLVASARKHLERVVRRVGGRRGPKIRIEVVAGDPHRRILDETRGMDAIVMSTVGRTGLSHLVMGSVAERVVRHSPIPVLTLRPDVARRAGRMRPTPIRRRAARRR